MTHLTLDPTVVLWQEAVASALVGSSRPLILPEAGTFLGDCLKRLATAQPERKLLDTAAFLFPYLRLGATLRIDSEPPPLPCPQDPRPSISFKSEAHLQHMLSGRYRPALPEWFRAVDAAGQRLPELSLPDLMELLRSDEQLRPEAMKVAGPRGVWIAGQNPRWAHMIDDPASASPVRPWRHENLAQVERWLKNVWSQYDRLNRISLLESLGDIPAPEDESLLEEALNEPLDGLRTLASYLLSRMPGSRFVRRMVDRLSPLIEIRDTTGKPPRRTKPFINLKLPRAFDDSMERDGVERDPAMRIGQKAWWVMQMLEAVPPHTWCARFGRSPTELFALLGPCQWNHLLVDGLARAAWRHRDIQWAEALLERNYRPLNDHAQTVEAGHLVGILPLERRELRATRLMEHDLQVSESERGLMGDLFMRYAHVALVECKHPWTMPFSRSVLRFLERRILASKVKRLELSPDEETLAYRMTPSLAEEAAACLTARENVDEEWKEAADEFVAILRFRYTILKEFEI